MKFKDWDILYQAITLLAKIHRNFVCHYAEPICKSNYITEYFTKLHFCQPVHMAFVCLLYMYCKLFLIPVCTLFYPHCLKFQNFVITHTHTHTRTCTHVHTHACTHACTHARTHTYKLHHPDCGLLLYCSGNIFWAQEGFWSLVKESDCRMI